MSPLILLGIVVAAPIVVAIIFRVNAAMLYMSLCVGEVLVMYVSGSNTTLPYVSHLDNSTLQIALLFAPAVLTSVFMFHSVKGSKMAFNIIPAVAAGLLAAFLVEPLLSGKMQLQINRLPLWHQAAHYQPVIIAAGAGVSLLFLWFQKRGSGHGHKH